MAARVTPWSARMRARRKGLSTRAAMSAAPPISASAPGASSSARSTATRLQRVVACCWRSGRGVRPLLGPGREVVGGGEVAERELGAHRELPAVRPVEVEDESGRFGVERGELRAGALRVARGVATRPRAGSVRATAGSVAGIRSAHASASCALDSARSVSPAQ